MTRVLVGASVRRNADLLQAHLSTLSTQRLPEGVKLSACHVDDFRPDERERGRALLANGAVHRWSTILDGVGQGNEPDFDDSDPETHRWQLSSFERVARNKQKLFDYAVEHGYDAVWVCDTDLLLDPYTLWSLLHADKPVAAAVYWTRWQRGGQAGPQVWLRHPYSLDGRGLDAMEFRAKLANRELVRVWGLGACMLVRTDVLKKGVRYWPLLPELVAQGGMMAGEDRTFSVLCERARVETFADSWPDTFHVYHPQDAALIPYWLARLQAPRNVRPQVGDLVSFVVEPLEDPRIQPQHIRGRLGQLRILPELEGAIRGLKPGESRIVPLHFPLHWPLASTGHPQHAPPVIQYRGTPKLVNLTLVDAKPYDYAPVLRDEFGVLDEVMFDAAGYTQEQMEQMRAVRIA